MVLVGSTYVFLVRGMTQVGFSKARSPPPCQERMLLELAIVASRFSALIHSTCVVVGSEYANSMLPFANVMGEYPRSSPESSL